ncbi:NAD-dependent epimerase/dehydratase family protein [Rubinisphaera margarita]|uniref:NAD-dependent epimerase/dehydratase family protein n=1 Tax=Rubinisphaera margarita TaxID=2909586 RepID=UPI001EE7CF04|nr:NAD(P)-dependent oxidoreductase [Rubinisphaera margarita]MCG6154823.1 NAD(P)-dependent oxidoreductase [Rubinisphaera margarita]
MRVFVAGASGAIGRPLVAELVRQGHTVTGMTRSDRGADVLRVLGARVVRVDAFDSDALQEAVRRSEAEVVIDQLTSLPSQHEDLPSAVEQDRRLRTEGGMNLFRAAQRCGVRRVIQQSSGFFLEPGEGLADESCRLAVNGSPNVADSSRVFEEMERRTNSDQTIEAVVLRYGFFYGPGTWYSPQGTAARSVRAGQIPIIGNGQGVWSWIHIEDAARATVDAMTIPPGTYHITDDHPQPVHQWLPAFAQAIGAPEPPRISEKNAREVAGEDTVYYHTMLRGASNAKAKATFGFSPRPMDWSNA